MAVLGLDQKKLAEQTSRDILSIYHSNVQTGRDNYPKEIRGLQEEETDVWPKIALNFLREFSIVDLKIQYRENQKIKAFQESRKRPN